MHKINPFRSALPAVAGLLFSFAAAAQELKALTPDDHGLWSELIAHLPSADGKWAAYTVRHKSADTLYLQERETKKRLAFPGHSKALFSQDGRWFACVRNDTVTLARLPDAELKRFAGFASAVFAGSGGWLAGTSPSGSQGTLSFVNLASGAVEAIHGATSCKANPDGKSMAVAFGKDGSERAGIAYFGKTILLKNIPGAAGPCSGFQWNEAGSALAFWRAKKNSTASLWWCGGIYGKLEAKVLDAENSDFFKNAMLTGAGLHLSGNGLVLFDVTDRPVAAAPPSAGASNVQVWRPDGRTLPPQELRPGFGRPQARWAAWRPSDGALMELEDARHGNAVLSSTDRHALLYASEDEAYLPTFRHGGEYRDIFVKSLLTGTQELLAARMPIQSGIVQLSPGGRYACYFKNGNWWAYDLEKKTHACLTEGFSTPLEKEAYDYPGTKPPYGSPGWTAGDKELLVYDRHDIWLLSPNGKQRRRLTRGRESGKIYRLGNDSGRWLPRASYGGFVSDSYDLGHMVLSATDAGTLYQGISLFEDRSTLPLFEKKGTIRLAGQAKTDGRLLAVESSFSQPPRLFWHSLEGQEEEVFQSNPQQRQFQWGVSEIISYALPDGTRQQAALFYPAGYVKGRQYPMVVSIYDKKAKEVHAYSAPSLYAGNGTTISVLAAAGYAVLCPDIAYTIGSPWQSALLCVEAATRQAVALGVADIEKLALTGHSFGGAETMYILGQSSLFKTAIAGAGKSDHLSGYLSLDGKGQSNMWRYEYSQLRMPQPFYSSSFAASSAIAHAQAVTTPLLLWAGTHDKQVDWQQSLMMHAALWRQEKESCLLAYPGEEHVLVRPANQRDLSLKILDWLDFYLKGGPKPHWLETGQPAK